MTSGLHKALRTFRLGQGVVLALAAMTLGACADSALPNSTPMPLGAHVPAPIGFLQFCQRRPEQCGMSLPLSPENKAKLLGAITFAQYSRAGQLSPAATAVPPTSSPLSYASGPARTDAVDPAESQAPPPLISASKSSSMLSVFLSARASPGDVDTYLSGHDHVRVFGGDLFADGLARLARSSSLSALLAATGGTEVNTADKAEDEAGLSPSVDAAQAPGAPALEDVAHPLPAPRPVEMSSDLMALLTKTTREINAKIAPASDIQAFGVDNYWTLPLSAAGPARGNCKHFALEKRRFLIAAGLPERSLSLAIVKTPWGELHAVLVVATDKGDFVLDNLSQWVTPWSETGYRWIVRQTTTDPLVWAMVASSEDAPASRASSPPSTAPRG